MISIVHAIDVTPSHSNVTPLLPMSRHSPLKSLSWKPALLRKKIGASACALPVRLEHRAIAPAAAALEHVHDPADHAPVIGTLNTTHIRRL
jgi:hypothetical protein